MWNQLVCACRGWSGTKDWKLVDLAVIGDYTLVAHNALDPRRGGSYRLSGQLDKQATGQKM
jgi:hypothetical protein